MVHGWEKGGTRNRGGTHLQGLARGDGVRRVAHGVRVGRGVQPVAAARRDVDVGVAGGEAQQRVTEGGGREDASVGRGLLEARDLGA